MLVYIRVFLCCGSGPGEAVLIVRAARSSLTNFICSTMTVFTASAMPSVSIDKEGDWATREHLLPLPSLLAVL